MYCFTTLNATAGSVVVPDFEMTTQATLRCSMRSVSSARYSSLRLFPAKTTCGALPEGRKLWESASIAHFAPR